jgi:hypothetical protein
MVTWFPFPWPFIHKTWKESSSNEAANKCSPFFLFTLNRSSKEAKRMKISKFNDMIVYQIHHTTNIIHIHYSLLWIAYEFVRFETTLLIANPYITISPLIPLTTYFLGSPVFDSYVGNRVLWRKVLLCETWGSCHVTMRVAIFWDVTQSGRVEK